MDVGNWAALISAVAAFGTALATLFLVLEMRKQRRNSYLPDIALLSTPVYGFRFRGFGVELSSSRDVPADYPISTQPGIELANVGLGSAKEVTFEWEWDMDEFIHIIHDLDKDGLLHVSRSNRMLRVGAKGDTVCHTNLAFEGYWSRDYVLPAQVRAERDQIGLPPGYAALLQAWVLLRLSGMESDSDPVYVAPPPLQVKIRYRDIGDSESWSQYSITFQVPLLMGGKPSSDPVFCMSSSFTPKRIRCSRSRGAAVSAFSRGLAMCRELTLRALGLSVDAR